MNPAPDARYAISADPLMFKAARLIFGASRAQPDFQKSAGSTPLFAAAMNTRCVSFTAVDVSHYPDLDVGRDYLTVSAVQGLVRLGVSFGMLRSVVEGISPKIVR